MRGEGAKDEVARLQLVITHHGPSAREEATEAMKGFVEQMARGEMNKSEAEQAKNVRCCQTAIGRGGSEHGRRRRGGHRTR
eukprot:7646211-Pyramimonas_sp.AAC.1